MRFVKPSDGRPLNTGRPFAYDKAKERAIEKQRSQYILLKCGHHTTWEADQFFSDSRPARDKMWCEICGKWKVKMPKPPSPVYDEPMF